MTEGMLDPRPWSRACRVPAEQRPHHLVARHHPQGLEPRRPQAFSSPGRGREESSRRPQGPLYRLACGMFAEECRKVAKLYPDVQVEEMMID